MKNKIQKILVAMITLIAVSTSHAQARESYAGRGAIAGAISGGVLLGTLGGAVGYEFHDFCPGDDCTNNTSAAKSTLIGVGLGVGIGAAGGAALGALIGLAIPKHKNVSISPTFDPTPGAVGGGVNLSLNF